MQQSVRCSRCGSPNYPGQQYCWNCGAQMGSICPSCGAPLEPNSKFCGSCGAQMPSSGFQQSNINQPAQQPYGYQTGQQQYAPPQQNYPYSGGSTASQPAQQSQWGAGVYATESGPRSQSQSSMPLVILLVVLLFALAGFAYWAFFGNPPWSSNTTFVSQIETGPTISISNISDSTASATITYTTRSDVVSRIEYGIDTTYAQSSLWETTYGTSHSVVLTDLTLGSRYYYRIVTKDENETQSTNEFPPFRAGSAE